MMHSFNLAYEEEVTKVFLFVTDYSIGLPSFRRFAETRLPSELAFGSSFNFIIIFRYVNPTISYLKPLNWPSNTSTATSIKF